MVTLAGLFKDAGFDVSLLVYNREDFFKDKLVGQNIKIYEIIENRTLFRIWKIRKFIRGNKYDAVISFLETPNFLNCIAGIGGRSWRVITSERSAKASSFLSYRGRIFGWFQRYSDAIVCNSHNAYIMWEKHYPRYKDKLRVIYNAVVLPEIKSEYIPLSRNILHVIIAASYQPVKNPMGLLRALESLKKTGHINIRIEWFGEKNVTDGGTKLYDLATEFIREHQLEDLIRLNGPSKEIAEEMNQSDIIGLFSRVEGLPNGICEGMMLGKPIFMTKISDFDILVSNSNGWLCDWDNPENIASQFRKAMQLKSEELLRLGKNSRSKAMNLFSGLAITKQWSAIFSLGDKLDK